ncbi:MAG TPA: ankyrin repeat domain-containing protein [Synergistaceae bacterium]|nr:ankyrin repeat domain-containing protein [Synergistaceae bacterium]
MRNSVKKTFIPILFLAALFWSWHHPALSFAEVIPLDFEIDLPQIPKFLSLCMNNDVEGFKKCMDSGEFGSGEDLRLKLEGILFPFLLQRDPDPEMLALLLSSGLDVNIRDSLNETPLMHAIKNNHSPEILSLLLKAGADVDVQNNHGQTPLMSLLLKNGSVENLDLILAASPDLTIKDSLGMPPITYAALISTDPVYVEKLLEAGSPVDIRDKTGKTPLTYAVFLNFNPEIARTLLTWGADPNAKDEDGYTPLCFSTLHPRKAQEIILMLIEWGAQYSEEARGSTGETSVRSTQ